jgi:hypothetical protein
MKNWAGLRGEGISGRKLPLYICEQLRRALHVGCIALAVASCAPASKRGSVGAEVLPGSCSGGPTSATIRRWLENPRTSSGNLSLAFTAKLSASDTRTSTLGGLVGNCLLQNQMFSLTKDSIYPSNLAAPTGASLEYAPGTPEFRQLNSFYAATQLRDLMGRIGANLGSLRRVNIDAHCRVSNNAYFSPSTSTLCLGYADVSSSKRIWAADDSDVVVHEAGHAVNHALASTSIMNSSGEAGAIDEAVADYWALTTQGNSQLSEWYLGFLGSMRDAASSSQYPASMLYEVHDDSRVLSQSLWRLRTALGAPSSDAIVSRTLSMLPMPSRLGDFARTYYIAAQAAGASASDLSQIRAEFTNRGLYRSDAPAGIAPAVSPAQGVYVIDDHTISAQVGGNCNGVLDVGETALVLVNLRNPGAQLGMGLGLLDMSSLPAGISVPSGGNVAEYYRFGTNQTFTSSLPFGPSREDATIGAAFLLKGLQAGAQTLSFNFRPMESDPLVPVSSTTAYPVSFTINVGSAATNSSCSLSSLWP